MDRILEIAKGKVDHAELFINSMNGNGISYSDGKLKEASSVMIHGYALRVIKDGKVGYSFTRNPEKEEQLFKNAYDVLLANIDAGFAFPYTEFVAPASFVYTQDLKSPIDLAEKAKKLHDKFKENVDAEVSVFNGFYNGVVGIKNSLGTSLSLPWSEYIQGANIGYHGTACAVNRYVISHDFIGISDDLRENMQDIFNSGTKEIIPPSSRMPVLFMPSSVELLLYTLAAGANGQTLCDGLSPISSKVGLKILDSKFSLYEDPYDGLSPVTRPFDDEGVARKKRYTFQNGIFKGFYFDLRTATKAGTNSTGNGRRSGPWYQDPVMNQPQPRLMQPKIEAGKTSIEDMIKGLKKGIVVENLVNAHSGNILSGDFSVGVCPAYYVENGEIVGRVKDTMISGNVWECLKDIIAVGDKQIATGDGYWFPALLIDDLKISD